MLIDIKSGDRTLYVNTRFVAVLSPTSEGGTIITVAHAVTEGTAFSIQTSEPIDHLAQRIINASAT